MKPGYAEIEGNIFISLLKKQRWKKIKGLLNNFSFKVWFELWHVIGLSSLWLAYHRNVEAELDFIACFQRIMSAGMPKASAEVPIMSAQQRQRPCFGGSAWWQNAVLALMVAYFCAPALLPGTESI